MDWSKVKNIIIVIFSILNLFLFGNIIIENSNKGISKEALEYTKRVLGERGVKLKCDIPQYSGHIVMLNYETLPYDKETYARALLEDISFNEKLELDMEIENKGKKITFRSDGTIMFKDASPRNTANLKDVQKLKNYLNQRFKGLGIPVELFIEDGIIELENETTCINLIEKRGEFLIYDNYIKAYVGLNGIKELEIKFRKITSLKTDEGMVMPAYQVLLSNFEKGKPRVITGIDIGFIADDTEHVGKEVQKNPVWRIRSEGMEPEYFDAYNGVRY